MAGSIAVISAKYLSTKVRCLIRCRINRNDRRSIRNIDGTPRTYRDRKDFAIEAARFLKSKQPHNIVEVKDLQSGDVTAVALRPELSDAPKPTASAH
jgi:hypothetical protein